ncbi:MAG: ATPase [Pseudomonadota bacterium]
MNAPLHVDMQMAPRGVPTPRAPQSIAETGLDEGFLIELLCKTVYRMGLERASEMAAVIKLAVPIIQDVIEIAKERKLIEPLGQLGAQMTSEMRYALTQKGKVWADEALTQSEYVGPAPIPLDLYNHQTKAQSIRDITLTEPMLQKVFAELTLSPSLMDELGPAVNSSSAMLLYGPPGNGKSSISHAICAAYEDHIYVPYAIQVEKQVILVYDPIVHRRVSSERDMRSTLRREVGLDPRFVPCVRPAVTTGGELTLDMLDLAYNPVSRVYEAPMQMKASGGVFVVDDFGRQRPTPQEVMNRLIVPLEAGVDYLALQTGRKFEVHFDSFVIFSTNIAPRKLVDDAALRRIRYKILVDRPSRDMYIQIFALTAEKEGLQLTEEVLAFLFLELYSKEPGAELHAFHPRFIIDQTVAYCAYKDEPLAMGEDALRHAWKNLFSRA